MGIAGAHFQGFSEVSASDFEVSASNFAVNANRCQK
jgi:hypothetical protein